MTGLETLENALKENLKKQSLCLDKYGLRVKNDHRIEYGQLVIEARELQDGIKWMKENLYQSA